jgi:hypothetical protein
MPQQDFTASRMSKHNVKVMTKYDKMSQKEVTAQQDVTAAIHSCPSQQNETAGCHGRISMQDVGAGCQNRTSRQAGCKNKI